MQRYPVDNDKLPELSLLLFQRRNFRYDLETSVFAWHQNGDGLVSKFWMRRHLDLEPLVQADARVCPQRDVGDQRIGNP